MTPETKLLLHLFAIRDDDTRAEMAQYALIEAQVAELGDPVAAAEEITRAAAADPIPLALLLDKARRPSPIPTPGPVKSERSQWILDTLAAAGTDPAAHRAATARVMQELTS